MVSLLTGLLLRNSNAFSLHRRGTVAQPPQASSAGLPLQEPRVLQSLETVQTGQALSIGLDRLDRLTVETVQTRDSPDIIYKSGHYL